VSQAGPPTMKVTRVKLFSFLLLGGVAPIGLAVPATAEQIVSREQDIADLRLGQRMMVDDGSCLAGQIKVVSGAKLTATGIARTRQCVPRLGPKKR
jgi:hypothetical protein